MADRREVQTTRSDTAVANSAALISAVLWSNRIKRASTGPNQTYYPPGGGYSGPTSIAPSETLPDFRPDSGGGSGGTSGRPFSGGSSRAPPNLPDRITYGPGD